MQKELTCHPGCCSYKSIREVREDAKANTVSEPGAGAERLSGSVVHRIYVLGSTCDYTACSILCPLGLQSCLNRNN